MAEKRPADAKPVDAPPDAKRAKVEKASATTTEPVSELYRYQELISLTDEDGEERYQCHLHMLLSKAPKLGERLAKRTPRPGLADSSLRILTGLDLWTAQLFLQWLYTGKLTHIQAPEREVDPEANVRQLSNEALTGHPKSMDDLDFVRLYVFARKWTISDLADAAMNALVYTLKRTRQTASAAALNAAYDALAIDDTLLNILEYHAWAVYGPVVTDLAKYPAQYRQAVSQLHASGWPRPENPYTGFFQSPTLSTLYIRINERGCRSSKPIDLRPLRSSLIDSLDDMVQVMIGTERQIFHVHRQLLCDCSSYFNSAFNTGFAEASTRKLTLDDLDVSTFRIFIHWLYSGNILFAQSQSETSSEHTGDDTADRSPQRLSIQARVELYVFADAYDVRHLRNDIMTSIVMHWEFDDSWQELASSYYDILTEAFECIAVEAWQCPLKKFFVTEAAFHWTTDDIEDPRNADLPSEFLAELLRSRESVRNWRLFGRDWRTDLCYLHEHPPGFNEEEQDCKKETTIVRQILRSRQWDEKLGSLLT